MSRNCETFVLAFTGLLLVIWVGLVAPEAKAQSVLMVAAALPDQAVPAACDCADCGAPAICVIDSDCDDGNACNGAEVCTGGVCAAGVELVCDNGNACDGAESCNPQIGCVAGTPMQCDDGDVCNGQETCDPSFGCLLSVALACEVGCGSNEVGACDAAGGCVCLPAPCEIIECGAIGSVAGTCNPATYGCDYVLQDANLSASDLTAYNLSGMDLSGADLLGATLVGADLQNADLTGADLRGADLSNADLSGADLTGAQYNTATDFPPGFDPAGAGMVLSGVAVPSLGHLGVVVLVGLILVIPLALRRSSASSSAP